MKRINKIAYLAGIVDADGCIDVNVAKPKGARLTPSYRVRLKVTMCEPHAIEILTDLFGGNPKLRTRSNPNHRPIWAWAIRGRNASAALKEMLPFLTVKKERAMFAIELADRVSSTVKSVKGKYGIQKTSVKEVEIRKGLADKLYLLNAKGTKRQYNLLATSPRTSSRSTEKD